MAELIQLGVSGLLASQNKLATTGHNIANANTPGYSRQEALLETAVPQFVRSGFLGNGVEAAGVRRVVDSFTTSEMRMTGNSFSRLDTLYENVVRMDDLIGNESTSLLPTLRNFFSAMQTVAENPASLSSRQTVLSQSELLVNRLNNIYGKLETRNEALNVQLEASTAELTSLAAGVAELNLRIASFSEAGDAQLPNDLMDRRDYLIQQMSEIAGVSVVENRDRSINVFLGNGQGIVIGATSTVIDTAPSIGDPAVDDIRVNSSGRTRVVTSEVSGGALGGILEFRKSVLDPIYNELGLLAIGISAEVNDQHQLGMDLDNELGALFFRDVNDTQWSRMRVFADTNNAQPDDRVLDVEITEVSELLAEDYELEFSEEVAGQYSVSRLSDGQTLATSTFSGIFPSTIEFDGLTITLRSGSFQSGDSFVLKPYRAGAREISMQVSNIRDLALAQPVRTEAKTTNRGTGSISPAEVIDTTTSYFNTTGQLSPPLIIEFTSATTYDILDNSDPTNPQQLSPPLSGLNFVPGVDNVMLPLNESRNAVSSDGSAIGIVQRDTVANAYPAEDVEFVTIDPETNAISIQSLTTVADASADITANSLSGLTGITATARNHAVLSDFSSSSALSITFNGVPLTGDDPDTIADSINSSLALSASGITASSNGDRVTIDSTTGVDFNFSIAPGLASDRVSVTGTSGDSITLTGLDAIPAVTVGGTIDLVLDEGVSIGGDSAIFSDTPTLTPRFLGFQTIVSGQPATGDRFSISYNKNGFSDNRNAVKIAELQSKKVLAGGQATLRDHYARTVDNVATKTKQTEISREAALTLFDRAKADRESTSGVSLDEEASNLINYELQYNAAAQLISVARGLFDTLLNSVR